MAEVMRPWDKNKRSPPIGIEPDLDEARRFLKLLDPSTEEFTFSTFDDSEAKRPALIEGCLHGTLEQHVRKLIRNNKEGAGVFVMVNAGDGKRRAADNVTSIRAVWQDDDQQWPGEFPLAPSLSVVSSPWRFQRYWFANDIQIDEHRAIMERLVADFGSDNGAKDKARVLRLPGFYHCKGTPYQVRIIGGSKKRYDRDEILAAFPPVEREEPAPYVPVSTPDDESDDDRLRNALTAIPAEDYHTWIHVGMALKDELGDAGRGVWDNWSAASTKFKPKDQGRRWSSFRGQGIGVGTLFYYALEAGWKPRHWSEENDEQAAEGGRIARALVENERRKKSGAAIAEEPQKLGPLITHEQLMRMNFPEIRYLCHEIIAEGLTILAGRPKAGKSWLALDLAMQVAQGGVCLGRQCIQGDVLYLALEDNLRRLKKRSLKLSEDDRLKNVTFATDWPKGNAAAKALVKWIEGATDPALIIIDTLAKVRDQSGKDDSYARDYEVVAAFQKIASQKNISVLVVHHTRKGDADDPFDTVSGTLGITGAADAILVMQREKAGHMVLHGRGRDIEGFSHVLTFDPKSCFWSITPGAAEEIILSDTKKRILAALRSTIHTMAPREIAEAAGIKEGSVKERLRGMLKEGLVTKHDRGKYQITPAL